MGVVSWIYLTPWGARVCVLFSFLNYKEISLVILKVVAWWTKLNTKWKVFQETCGHHYVCRCDNASKVPLPIYRICHITNSCVYASHIPHTVEQDIIHVVPEVLRDVTPLTLNNRIKLDSGIVFVQLTQQSILLYAPFTLSRMCDANEART